MLVLTRVAARIGVRDGIHIFGIHGMPQITIGDTGTIITIQIEVFLGTGV